jgi:hypothetical protein
VATRYGQPVSSSAQARHVPAEVQAVTEPTLKTKTIVRLSRHNVTKQSYCYAPFWRVVRWIFCSCSGVLWVTLLCTFPAKKRTACRKGASLARCCSVLGRAVARIVSRFCFTYVVGGSAILNDLQPYSLIFKVDGSGFSSHAGSDVQAGYAVDGPLSV